MSNPTGIQMKGYSLMAEAEETELMMVPQVASGCLTPRPRKDSVDSVMMMPPMFSVAMTISWGMTFGTRWRKMRSFTRMPVASVATMNSCSRRESICPRTRRAMLAQPMTPSAAIIIIRRMYVSMRIASISAPRMIMIGIIGRQ